MPVVGSGHNLQHSGDWWGSLVGSSHSDGKCDRDGKGVPNARMWEVWIDRQRRGDAMTKAWR